jgi:hypothetical protein
MPDYWIKLYHEIIDDPKMATLPDRLWRRAIELFLLAGKLCRDKSGILPDTKQLAWLLRIPTDDLQTDLIQLASTGIIESVPGGWKVINFEKRQSPATVNERVKYHRERKQKEQYYGNVTELKRNVTQINRLTDTETNTEREATPPPTKRKSTGKKGSTKDERLEHPALKVYRSVANLHVPVAWRDDVIQAVGERSEDWGQVVKSWIGHGWNPQNISGMLEVFGKHEPPQKRKTGTVEIEVPGIGRVEAKR